MKTFYLLLTFILLLSATLTAEEASSVATPSSAKPTEKTPTTAATPGVQPASTPPVVSGTAPVQPIENKVIPTIDASAYLLQDFYSGSILLEKNIDNRVQPASLTKLMTAYVVFTHLESGKIKLSDQVKISDKAWRMGGSRMYLETNTLVSVESLIKGMVIQSGNDASVALAEYVANSEAAFVEQMNSTAQQLKLNGTHYTNCTGLPEENHYTTVRDLAEIAKAIIRDFPKYYKLYSEREFTYNGITQSNRNLLLWFDKTVDGVKTGYTESAGYCLIASAKRPLSSTQGEMRLLSVVMGTDSKKARATESQKLLDYGFQQFETYLLVKAQQTLMKEPVWQGSTNVLQLGLAQPLYVTVPKGQYSKLSAVLKVNKHIQAPVVKGNSYGKIVISLDNRILVQPQLVALHDVETGDLWRQLVDYFWLQFEQ